LSEHLGRWGSCTDSATLLTAMAFVGNQGCGALHTIPIAETLRLQALPPGKGGCRGTFQSQGASRLSVEVAQRLMQAIDAGRRSGRHSATWSSPPVQERPHLAKSPAPAGPAESCKAASVHVFHAGTHTHINVFTCTREACAALVQGLAGPQNGVPLSVRGCALLDH
jgi:hypothetical protein